MVTIPVLALLFAASCDASRGSSSDESGAGGDSWTPPAAAFWGSTEYASLAAHVETECGPRRSDPAYGEAIDSRHLTVLSDDPAHFGELLEHQEALRRLLHAYRRCGLLAETFDVGVLNLEIAARMVPVAEQVLSGIPPDDPTLPTRLEGYRQALDGIAEVVRGSVLMLADPAGGWEMLAPLESRYLAAVARLRAAGPPGFLDSSRDLLRGLGPGSRPQARQAIINRLRQALEAPSP